MVSNSTEPAQSDSSQIGASRAALVSGSFQRHFRRPPEGFVSAPAMAHLLGDSSASDGRMALLAPLPCRLSMALARRPDRRAFLRTNRAGGELALNLENLQKTWEWTDHVSGVIEALEHRGLELPGFEALVDSDIPEMAGLASSEALRLAFAMAISRVMGEQLTPSDLSDVCLQAESLYLGTTTTRPITLAALSVQEAAALEVDCTVLTTRTLKFEFPDLRLLLCDTMVRQPTGVSDLQQQEDMLFRTLGQIRKNRPGVESFLDVADADVEALEPRHARAARFVCSENHSVRAGADALEAGDLRGLMEQMAQAGARVDPKTPAGRLCRLAEKLEGALCARPTSRSEAGSVLMLARSESVEALVEQLDRFYYRPGGFACSVQVLRGLGGPAGFEAAGESEV